MWNTPSKKRLSKIPSFNEKENTPLAERLVYLHLFVAGCDWYIIEYNGNDTFFGFAIINSDKQNAEWGYMSFKELRDLKVYNAFEVDCEHERWFPIQPVGGIKKIRDCVNNP